MVREAERSCDEETIASLGVSPSTYARSLLDVLECKQRLHGAPALPGVRSVDVTRSRLERIMRLRHGSHASTPVWVWLLFFCCVAVLLPGGAWLSAQEEKSEGSPQKINSEKPNSTTEQLAPPAIGAWAESWQNESIDVGDLLNKLEAQHGDREVARGMLLSMIPQRSVNAINAEGHATMRMVPPFSIDSDDLHVFETREQIAIVKNGLEELRRCGFDSVQLRLKLLAIPAEQLDALGLIWEKALEPTSQVMARLDSMRPTQEMQAGSLPAAPAALHPVQPASAVGEAAQPVPVTIVEATSGAIALGGFKAKVRNQIENNQPLAGPVHSDLGIAGWLTVGSSSNTVTTHCAVIDTEKAIDISKLTESGEKQSVLSAPQITCSNGGCVQVVSYSPWSIKPQIASFDKPAPIQPLPQLGFSGFSLAAHPLIETKTDSSEKTNIDLSLICETREVTRLDKFIFEGRGVNDANGERTTSTVEQPNVELKKLAVRHKLQAGESLLISSREPLAPQSENKILVIVATCEVVPAGTIQTEHGQTLKSNVLRPEPTTDPLPILGVVTAGTEVKKLPAPSSGEILTAWRKAKAGDQGLAGLNESRIGIVENCIGDFADEKRFVPLIGDAILHHRLYKCDIFQIEYGDNSESRGAWLGSIVIDHSHFHMLDGNSN